MNNRIQQAFARGKAFIPFITGGDPDLETTGELVREMEAAGADIIEIGIPFSDPIAEGPVIQAASERALQGGTTVDKLFDLVEELRKTVKIPLLFMGYANSVFGYGAEKFFEKCSQVGVDGLILPDIPFEEKDEFQDLSEKYQVTLISMVAPTSSQRAVGDTQRPLYFLFLAGIINVVLNLFFVIGFHLDVAGVAIATVISQCVSAGLVLLCLVKSHTPYRVDLRRLGLKKDKLWGMVKIGLPAGIQGCSFSISNVLIQSSINSFGAMAMAGNTAASNIEGFVSTAQDAFAQAALSFTGQNMGAGKTRRVNRILLLCLVLVTGTGLVLGTGAFLLGHQLLGIYSADPQVIAFGIRRMSICCVLQFVGGLMGVMVGVLRGMGYSFIPMAITIGFVCGFRVVWIFTVFAMFPTLEALYVSYPITWGLAALCDGVCFLIVHRHVSKKQRLATGARE